MARATAVKEKNDVSKRTSKTDIAKTKALTKEERIERIKMARQIYNNMSRPKTATKVAGPVQKRDDGDQAALHAAAARHDEPRPSTSRAPNAGTVSFSASKIPLPNFKRQLNEDFKVVPGALAHIKATKQPPAQAELGRRATTAPSTTGRVTAFTGRPTAFGLGIQNKATLTPTTNRPSVAFGTTLRATRTPAMPKTTGRVNSTGMGLGFQARPTGRPSLMSNAFGRNDPTPDNRTTGRPSLRSRRQHETNTLLPLGINIFDASDEERKMALDFLKTSSEAASGPNLLGSIKKVVPLDPATIQTSTPLPGRKILLQANQELRRTGRKQLRFSSIEEQRESTGTDDVKENLKIEVKKVVEEDWEQQSDTDDIAQQFKSLPTTPAAEADDEELPSTSGQQNDDDGENTTVQSKAANSKGSKKKRRTRNQVNSNTPTQQLRRSARLRTPVSMRRLNLDED
ncbi:hypothetical protein WR25_02443 [Diploscapter pachys]|uniref:Uncharacterized protein n=1 Tax=Diploscapter pachys TaxID=2018661 RepID=A0A2A2KKQ5_9BILA|nr:hypothetical protein WR25_02443 [Diploscapter pachys]